MVTQVGEEGKKPSNRGRSFLNEVSSSLPKDEPKSTGSKKTAGKKDKDSKDVFSGIAEKPEPKELAAPPKADEDVPKIAKGYKCWAWIDQHQKYYRARVTSVKEDGKLEVLYRDFYAEVTPDDLTQEKPDNLKAKIVKAA